MNNNKDRGPSCGLHQPTIIIFTTNKQREMMTMMKAGPLEITTKIGDLVVNMTPQPFITFIAKELQSSVQQDSWSWSQNSSVSRPGIGLRLDRIFRSRLFLVLVMN